MKSVLVSVRPEWCVKICNEMGKDEKGKPIYEKELEVRKSKPANVPFLAYIYETKGRYVKSIHGAHTKYGYGRGKIIGEFVCDRVEDFSKWKYDYSSLLRHICLYAATDYSELDRYLKGEKKGYGWHISDLVIYDKPKDLKEFLTCEKKLSRPPMSWQYVENLGGQDVKNDGRIV